MFGYKSETLAYTSEINYILNSDITAAENDLYHLVR